MKRDYNVMRLILREVRDGERPPELQRYDEASIVYNSALLVNDECVDGDVIRDGNGNYASVVMLQLTNKGHDLLEKLDTERGDGTKKGPTVANETQFTLSIFVSHSSKDEKLAAALVELLRNALNISASEIRCTSVNGYRLPAGAPTEEQLRKEVHESKAFIGLITPASMASAYVMFELGARWGAGLHLVPLLGAGADSTFLRGPLGSLNALDCADAAQVHQLLDDLSRLLCITQRTPAAAYQSYIDKLVGISKGSNSPKEKQPSQQTVAGTASEDMELEKIEVQALKLFCEAGPRGLQEDFVVEKLNLHRLKTNQLLERLEKRGLLYLAVRMGLPGSYRLTPKGRDYLIEKNLL